MEDLLESGLVVYILKQTGEKKYFIVFFQSLKKKKELS